MSHILDRSELLEPVIASGRSRAIAAGVDANQYDAITAGLSLASQWSSAFRAAGAEHRSRAEAAERAGCRISAADAYLAAAACAHIATTLPTPWAITRRPRRCAMHWRCSIQPPSSSAARRSKVR